MRAELGLERHLQQQSLEGEHLVSEEKAREILDSTPNKGEIGVLIGKLMDKWKGVARGGYSDGVPPHQD